MVGFVSRGLGEPGLILEKSGLSCLLCFGLPCSPVSRFPCCWSPPGSLPFCLGVGGFVPLGFGEPGPLSGDPGS